MNITLNATGLLVDLQKRLKYIDDNVTIALTALAELPNRASLVSAPGVFMHTSFGDHPTSTEETRSICMTWIVGQGLRDTLEAFGLFCEEAWRFLLLAVEGASGSVAVRKSLDLSGATIHDIADAVLGNSAKEIDRLGVGQKIGQFEARLGINLPWRPDVESINQARNCLTHRLGVVGAIDVNDSAASVLRVSFRATEIVITAPDGKQTPLSEPRVVEGGGSVGIRMGIARERTFKRGERIGFSAQEFMHLVGTVYRVAAEITDGVTKHINAIRRPPPAPGTTA